MRAHERLERDRKVLLRSMVALAVVMATFSPVTPSARKAVAGVDPKEVEALKAQVERIRGIRTSSAVRSQYLSRQELRDRILEDLREEKSQRELKSAEEVMKMLGLIPQDLDLEGLLVELYTEQIGGFYDSEEDTFYLVAEATEMNVMDRLTVAHELVHFLQDIRFELDRAPFKDKEEEVDDDQLFAASCLVEGDAMLTTQLWAQENLTPSEMVQLGMLSRQVPTEVLNKAPRYVRESLLFPYQGGMEFVSYLYRRGGFTAVDGAFEDPPRSSEEVMHPEKYLAGEGPMEVSLPSLGEEGWEKAYENVLGEFDVYQLLVLFIPDQEAKRAAEGWGGSKYGYFRAPGGERVLACVFLWDSSSDAVEFAEALLEHLRKRFGARLNPADDMGWRLLEAGGYRYAWEVSGKRVRFIQSTHPEALEKIRSAMDEMTNESVEAKPETEGPEESEGDWRLVIVVALVVALFLLGLVLSAFILISHRRGPQSPGW